MRAARQKEAAHSDAIRAALAMEPGLLMETVEIAFATVEMS